MTAAATTAPAACNLLRFISISFFKAMPPLARYNITPRGADYPDRHAGVMKRTDRKYGGGSNESARIAARHEGAPRGARLCQRIRRAVEKIRDGLAGDRNGEPARGERRALAVDRDAHRKVKFPAVIAFGPLKVPGMMPGPTTFPAVRPVNEVRTRIGRRCRIGTTTIGPT